MAIINGVGRVGIRNYVAPTSTSTNPLWNSLVAYYTGDNTPNDAKGTYNGTLINGTTYGTGKVNQGFSFDGINDYVSVGNAFDTDGSTPFSMSTWVKADVFVGDNRYILSTQGDGSYKGIGIAFFGASELRVFLVNTLNTNELRVTASYTFSTNTWYNISITYDGSKSASGLKIYVNGVSASLNIITNGLTGSISFPNRSLIGARNVSNMFFKGIIDELGWWSKVLTPTEVTELYNAGAGKQYVAPTPAYTTRTTAFAAATGIADTTILNALNTFDLGLISNGLDTKMKALYPFVGGTATTHKFNFMDARDLNIAYRLQFNGGLTHSSTGVLPNGTNGYANTFLNSTTNLTLTNHSFGVYSRTESTAPGTVPIGNYDGGSSLLQYGTSGYLGSGPVSTGGITFTASPSIRLILGSRLPSPIGWYGYRNGVSLGGGGTNISDLPNHNIYLFARNSAGGANIFSVNELSFAFIGNGLTSIEVTNFTNLVNTMQTSLSRQV